MLMGMDMYVLQEMESNGMLVDVDLCGQKSKEIEAEIESVTAKVANLYPGIPINFNSPDQLSAFLYGGSITETH